MGRTRPSKTSETGVFVRMIGRTKGGMNTKLHAVTA
jgi:hypothetical protein